MSAGRSIARIFLDAVSAGVRSAFGTARSSGRPTSGTAPATRTRRPAPKDAYPGDYTGVVHLQYRPKADGRADPGEVVWGWVPFEEDHTQGKDRPVLVLARDDAWLLCLMLTSKDHDRDAAQEARWGRIWFDIGTGAWDRQGRPSEVRLDRILRIEPGTVRREGAALDRRRYDAVAAALRDLHGW